MVMKLITPKQNWVKACLSYCEYFGPDCGGRWWGRCIGLPGVAHAGNSEREVRALVAEHLREYYDQRVSRGGRLPRPQDLPQMAAAVDILVKDSEARERARLSSRTPRPTMGSYPPAHDPYKP